MILQWDKRNVSHISEHGVSRDEARYIIDHPRSPYPREIGDEKNLVWGQTRDGRYLQVIFVYLDDEEIDFTQMSFAERLSFLSGEDYVAYVVHARDLTHSEKHAFRRTRR